MGTFAPLSLRYYACARISSRYTCFLPSNLIPAPIPLIAYAIINQDVRRQWDKQARWLTSFPRDSSECSVTVVATIAIRFGHSEEEFNNSTIGLLNAHSRLQFQVLSIHNGDYSQYT